MKKKLLIETVNYITGMKKNIQLNGKSAEVKIFSEVLVASRKLYEALHKKNVKLIEIEKLVENKKSAAKEYYSAFKVTWPF